MRRNPKGILSNLRRLRRRKAMSERKVTPMDRYPTDPQETCPLFRLPGEIRDLIFYYALLPYENPHKEYARDTCYKRPEQSMKRCVNVALLRACRAIYFEAKHFPWANSPHFLYLTGPTRAPPTVEEPSDLQRVANEVYKDHGKAMIPQVYVYAQCAQLEGGRLNGILKLQHFFPRTITLSLRYTDWWWWEEDLEPHVKGGWVAQCRFPDSIKSFEICFEYVNRKKDRIQLIAAQAKEGWFFRKQDGTVLSAKGSNSTIKTWTGSSIWNGRRWIREESRFKEVDYYCETVTWTPTEEWPGDAKMKYAPELRSGQDNGHAPPLSMVTTAQLDKMGLTNATAEEIRQAFNSHRRGLLMPLGELYE